LRRENTNLAIDAAADAAVRQMPFTVTVVRDVMVWSNFWNRADAAADLSAVLPGESLRV